MASAKAGKSRFFHQFYELIEQVIRVVGAGGCFGVVLDENNKGTIRGSALSIVIKA